jgi:queuine tRNA-ribosyltransferase
MPVGTVGSVKAVSQQELNDLVRAQIILGNSYHLFLRPGLETLELAGGLHRFMGWQKPILSDSGGYQVFSLAGTRKISEEGVTFQSHIDGSRHMFSPERVVDIQRSIGADIIMAFDECPSSNSDFNYTKSSMERTHRWLDRCLRHFESGTNRYGYAQSLFPIVQGGIFPELRRQSCDYIASKQAAGNAIGGLSVGEPDEKLYEMTALCCDLLPGNKPRYLMGVGTPWNILEAISLGIDMFDCVMPTRNGRNAMLFTSKGVINIDNKKWENDFSPIDDGIECPMSNYYSKAYLRHLIRSKEILGLTIASVQNLAFYLHLVSEARNHIMTGDFSQWKNDQMPIIQQRL